jgi:CBS domain containing-hemolysin-like protein
MTLLVISVLLSLVLSFVCSLMEATILSVTPAYIAQLEHEGRPSGKHLRQLKTQIDRPLAAILSLNTATHTLGAAIGGAQAQALWNAQALLWFSALYTLAILVISELVPKTLGAVYWRATAPPGATILRVMIWVMAPLVWLSQRITRLIGRGQAHEGHPATVSRDELVAAARLAQQQGVLGRSESRILNSVFRLGSVRSHDIMTPRTVMFAVNEETPVRDVLVMPELASFSRIPLWREHHDDVIGYVRKDEVLLRAARDEHDLPLKTLRRDLLIVPDSLPVMQLFEQMLDKREQIGLVVDEYGGVEGIVTMEDVIETVLGLEIVDEADTVQDMREMARAKWYERALRLGLVPPEAEPPPAHRSTPPPRGASDRESSRKLITPPR